MPRSNRWNRSMPRIELDQRSREARVRIEQIERVLMSLVAGALVLWRMLLNYGANTDLDDFLPVFQQTLRKGGVKAAVNLCKDEKGMIPNRLFVAGLEAADQGAAAMRRSMAN